MKPTIANFHTIKQLVKQILLTLCFATSITPCFADGSITNLAINTTAMKTPFIKKGRYANISDQSGIELKDDFIPIVSGISYYTSQKQNYVLFNLAFGEQNLNISSVSWVKEGNLATFDIQPAIHQFNQMPSSGDYCIAIMVDGNEINKPICSIAIQKGDAYDLTISEIGDVLTRRVVVNGFTSHSQVQITITPGKSQIAQCNRNAETGKPICKFDNIPQTKEAVKANISIPHTSTTNHNLARFWN